MDCTQIDLNDDQLNLLLAKKSRSIMPGRKLFQNRMENLFRGISNVWGSALGIEKGATQTAAQPSPSVPASSEQVAKTEKPEELPKKPSKKKKKEDGGVTEMDVSGKRRRRRDKAREVNKEMKDIATVKAHTAALPPLHELALVMRGDISDMAAKEQH
ncbi:hypothetical protein Y032_1039g3470 [Ancylostoma ceylanicum]|uniref:Uncharacterized protein n=1 Tax=Ancylostoma ceylanicum TaxID=53326 RepID=A0A016W792_9BILA|nr:hypothetical protein Y032_1039g3470 [Ancylostoma ceylanicum]